MVRVLLMSIKPIYSAQILARKKTFELRRSNVKVREDDIIIVYASSPIKAVVGIFTVAGVECGSPAGLWSKHSHAFGIEKGDYFEYFDGTETVHAIKIGHVVPVEPVVPLDNIRERIHDFRPPQSYQWWRRDLADLLGHGVEVLDVSLRSGASNDGRSTPADSPE